MEHAEQKKLEDEIRRRIEAWEGITQRIEEIRTKMFPLSRLSDEYMKLNKQLQDLYTVRANIYANG